ncbi:MAG: hypothetical protein KJ964_05165 [Verrucomicrobia bacterium]|nr:hypothetical protein [Verrucomicrobiota bacterium]MBU1734473.1 hypothetical protein [Verrucomicrobiota bacterium]MBU1856063.1 hypothetical protein [Verrucomicrobiota bacterium]
MKAFLLFLGVGIALTWAGAATNAPVDKFWPWGKSRDWPAELKVSLVSDRTNYFLGETILLHYRIENVGSSNVIEISVGGDYRGSTRADRFNVTAVSAGGNPVADPTPLMHNFGGGMLPSGGVKPGGDWFEEVYVNEYCHFDVPGTYTIRAFHDLGFGPQQTNDPRRVTLRLELRAPTEDQARTILADAENAKPYSGVTWGHKGEARLDYHCIRWPTFLRPLQERAQRGSEPALEGIASIRTLDASRALVSLLEHTNAAFAAKAAQLIEVRLPHPESEFKGPWGDQRRQFIIENAWDDSLSPPVRDYCVRLLDGTHYGDLLKASSLLHLIGTERELPSLQRALEVAVAQTNAEYLADIHFPAPIRATDALLGAALAINPKLDVVPTGNLSPGQLLLFIARHGGGETVLTKEDEAVFTQALQHPLPCVRMKTLEQLPKNIPASLADWVTSLMLDPNVGVSNYAFEAARRMQEPKHRTIALSVLKTAEDEWLMRAANDIALKYNARYECASIWASRLVAPKHINDYLPHQVIQQLFDIVVGKKTGGDLKIPGDSEAARALSARWQQFLDANQRKISEGQWFKIEELPDDLGIHRSNGSSVTVGR